MLERPEVLNGVTVKLKHSCGSFYITLNFDDDGNLREIFTRIGKAGGCAAAQCESIGRLASGWLRDGGDPQTIIKQLKGITCHQHMKDSALLSCADAVAAAIKKVLDAKKGESV